MRHGNIKLRELKTVDDCVEAMDSIDRDHNNYTSSCNYLRGADCTLTTAAQAKYARVYRKMQTMEIVS
jgi:hypothetical protein